MSEAAFAVYALQAAQKQLEQQVAAAQQLSTEVEQLKQENLEAWQMKYELESQMAAYKANLDGMQRQGGCMQKVCGAAESSCMNSPCLNSVLSATRQTCSSKLAGFVTIWLLLKVLLLLLNPAEPPALQEEHADQHAYIGLLYRHMLLLLSCLA